MGKSLCELLVAVSAVYGLYCAFYGLFFRMALEKRRGLKILVEREPSDRLSVRMYVAKKLMGTRLFDSMELTVSESIHKEREKETSLKETEEEHLGANEGQDS